LNIKTFLSAYLNSINDPNEKQSTIELLEDRKMKNLIAWFDPSTGPALRGKEVYSPFDDLSVPVKEIADHMNDRINSVTEEYMSTTQSFNSDELSVLLKNELARMEAEIQLNTALQADEKLALLAVIVMQNQSMNAMLAFVKSSFESSTGGKIAINWGKIRNIVASILVQAVAVAITVAVVVGVGVYVGAIAKTAWIASKVAGSTFITNGMAIGFGIGFIVGSAAA
jgi:hypothetical protein